VCLGRESIDHLQSQGFGRGQICILQSMLFSFLFRDNPTPLLGWPTQAFWICGLRFECCLSLFKHNKCVFWPAQHLFYPRTVDPAQHIIFGEHTAAAWPTVTQCPTQPLFVTIWRQAHTGAFFLFLCVAGQETYPRTTNMLSRCGTWFCDFDLSTLFFWDAPNSEQPSKNVASSRWTWHHLVTLHGLRREGSHR